jgi:hypothetical protein
MNPAGKLQMAMELYNKGMLCKCTNHQPIGYRDLERIEEEFELIHEDDCEGHVKIKELLFGDLK